MDMMWLNVTVLLCYLCVQGGGVRILELLVPPQLAEGGGALLGCRFQLQDEELFSVKWYKDGQEFYSYAPRRHPPRLMYAVPGVTVDDESRHINPKTNRVLKAPQVLHSSSEVVALRGLSRRSGGRYGCEVCGEAPRFSTDMQERNLTMYYLPQGPPSLSGQQAQYRPGDRLAVNCSSAARPAARLGWWLNRRPAPRRMLRGPWLRTAATADASDAIDTLLQLRFTVSEKHFRDGVMTIMCQSTLAPLYQEEVTLTFVQDVVTSPAPEGTSELAVTSEPWGALDTFLRTYSQQPDDHDIAQKEHEDSASTSSSSLNLSALLCLLNFLLVMS